MDEDIARWVIEFLLRHSPSDQLLNGILAKVPISTHDFRLKKTLLLRSIQTEISAGSVSETILDTLKTIEDLNKKEGIATTSSMKAAYCAIAVECTVKYVDGSVDKHEIERIWRGKNGNLKGSDLVTEDFIKWRDEIETAVGKGDVLSMLLKINSRNDALRLVGNYLREAWGTMGPTFLELAVNQLKEKESGDGDDAVAQQRGNVLPKRKHIGSHRRTRVPVKVTDNKELDIDVSCSKYDILHTPEVNKVQAALKSSSLELQAIDTDPLPGALLRAEAVVSDMARENQNHEPLVEKQIDVDNGVSDPSDDASGEFVQANKDNSRNQICSTRNNASNLSLMERNSSAHAYECNDSIDDSPSPGGPSNHFRRICIPSPKRGAESPLQLKKREVTKFSRRRKIKKWIREEEEALRNGVQKYVIQRLTVEKSGPDINLSFYLVHQNLCILKCDPQTSFFLCICVCCVVLSGKKLVWYGKLEGHPFI